MDTMHLALENHCAERATRFCSQHLLLKETRNRLRYCLTMRIQETTIRPTMTLIRIVRNGKNKSSNLRFRMLVKTSSRRTNLSLPDQHRPHRAILINTSICLLSRMRTTKPKTIQVDFPLKVIQYFVLYCHNFRLGHHFHTFHYSAFINIFLPGRYILVECQWSMSSLA